MLGRGDEPFRKRQVSVSLSRYFGRLGEQFIDKQTGDIDLAKCETGPVFMGYSGVQRTPDSFDYSFGMPPILGDVKVGFNTNRAQAEDFLEAVKRRLARPGIIFLLESPITGRVGTTRTIGELLVLNGFSLVYFIGPWWDAMQEDSGQGHDYKEETPPSP